MISIELTTQMLATLFDFPFEDRRKLTRWSDVATAVPGFRIVDTEEQRREELRECGAYFTELWNKRGNWRAEEGDLIPRCWRIPMSRWSMYADGISSGNIILLIVGGKRHDTQFHHRRPCWH